MMITNSVESKTSIIFSKIIIVAFSENLLCAWHCASCWEMVEPGRVQGTEKIAREGAGRKEPQRK